MELSGTLNDLIKRGFNVICLLLISVDIRDQMEQLRNIKLLMTLKKYFRGIHEMLGGIYGR